VNGGSRRSIAKALVVAVSCLPTTLVSGAAFPLPEGLVALELPDQLSKDSYEDLKAWIEVMLRSAGRSVSDSDKGETPRDQSRR
jgi:hypothetical protein